MPPPPLNIPRPLTIASPPRERSYHTPSTAFRHLPPNSARFSCATEGALFISAQLSTDAVSALRKVRVLIRLWKQPSAQAESRFGLAVRRQAGKRKDLGSIPLLLSFSSEVVVYGHGLVTLSLTINETLKWLSSLPILMQVILVVTV